MRVQVEAVVTQMRTNLEKQVAYLTLLDNDGGFFNMSIPFSEISKFGVDKEALSLLPYQPIQMDVIQTKNGAFYRLA